MSLTVRCPACPATFHVLPEQLGRRGRCTQCGVRLELATPVAVAVMEPPAQPLPPAEPVAEQTWAALAARPAAPAAEPLPLDDDAPADSRPARGSRSTLLIALAVVGVLGGGVGGALLVRHSTAPAERQPEPQTAATDPPPSKPVTPVASPTPTPPQPKTQTPPAPKSEPPVPTHPGMKTLKLPQSVVEVMFGGDGRYLVFRLADGNLLLHDVVAEKTLGMISAGVGRSLVAVGRTKLFLARPDDGRITRYDIATCRQEFVAEQGAPREELVHMAVGSATDGPLALVTRAKPGEHRLRLLEPHTLADLRCTVSAAKLDVTSVPGNLAKWPGHLAVSANGQTVIAGDQYFVRSGRSITGGKRGDLKRYVPTPDGDSLVGPTAYRTNGLPVPVFPLDRWCWPVGGPFLMTVEHRPAASPAVKLFLHIGVDTPPIQPLSELGPLPVPDGLTAWAARDRYEWATRVSQRVLFLPHPGVLVFVPPGSNTAELYPVDLPQLVGRFGQTVAFTSVPPADAWEGHPYLYQATAVARQGPVTFRLVRGPAGTTVSAEGLVQWLPPGDKGFSTETRIGVKGADGREEQQRFGVLPPPPKTGLYAPPPPKKGAIPDLYQRPKVDSPEPKKTDPVAVVPPKQDPPVAPPPKEPLVTKGPMVPDTLPKKEPPVVEPPKKDPVAVEPPRKEDETKTIKLPAPSTQVAVGGGGRYIALHLPKVRQIAVFDAKQQKVAKYLPAAEDTVVLAAGRDHLFVVNNTAGVMQRWSLTTFEKEATVKLPEEGPYTTACMGSDSAGPLLLVPQADRFGTTKPSLLNPVSLRPIPTGAQGLPGAAANTVRATPDGRVFCWHSGGGFGGVTVVEVADGKATAKSFNAETYGLVPGPGGRYFYAADGVYGDQMRRVHPEPTKPRAAHAFVPAVHGNLFLGVEAPAAPRFPGDPLERKGSGKVHVFFQGQFTPLATLTDLADLAAASDKAVYLLPRYNLLVLLGKNLDELVLHPFDLDALLAKSETDYLVVTSDPPAEAVAGTRFEYTPVVRSKKGGAKVKLDAGPDGMKLADGRLTWEVPADMVGKDVAIILTVSDASGQEMFHTFRVAVKDRAKPPEPPKAP